MITQIMLVSLSDQLRLPVQHGEKKESIREKKLKQLKLVNQRRETKEVVGKGGYIVFGDKKKVKMRDGHGDDINSDFFNRIFYK